MALQNGVTMVQNFLFEWEMIVYVGPLLYLSKPYWGPERSHFVDFWITNFLLQSEICWSTQWLPPWLTQQGSGSWYHYLKFAAKWARNVLMQCLTSLVRDRLCALQRCFFTEENWIPIRGNNWWQDIEDLWGSFFEWIGGKVCPHWWRHICVHQKHTIQSIPVPITDLNLAYWIRIVCIIKTQ